MLKTKQTPLIITIPKPNRKDFEFAPAQLLPFEIYNQIIDFVCSDAEMESSSFLEAGDNMKSLLYILVIFPFLKNKIKKIIDFYNNKYFYNYDHITKPILPYCIHEIIISERIINIKPMIDIFGLDTIITYCCNNFQNTLETSKGKIFIEYLLNDYDNMQDISELTNDQLGNIAEYVSIPRVDKKIFSIVAKIFYLTSLLELHKLTREELSLIIKFTLKSNHKSNHKSYNKHNLFINYYNIISQALEKNYTLVIKLVLKYYVFKGTIIETEPYIYGNISKTIDKINVHIVDNFSKLKSETLDLYLELLTLNVSSISHIANLIKMCITFVLSYHENLYCTSHGESNNKENLEKDTKYRTLHNNIINYLITYIQKNAKFNEKYNITNLLFIYGSFNKDYLEYLVKYFNIQKYINCKELAYIFSNKLCIDNKNFKIFLMFINDENINNIKDTDDIEYLKNIYKILIDNELKFFGKYKSLNLEDETLSIEILRNNIIQMLKYIPMYYKISDKFRNLISVQMDSSILKDRITKINDLLIYVCKIINFINIHISFKNALYIKIDLFEKQINEDVLCIDLIESHALKNIVKYLRNLLNTNPEIVMLNIDASILDEIKIDESRIITQGE